MDHPEEQSNKPLTLLSRLLVLAFLIFMVCLLLPAFTGRTGNPSGHAANTAYNLKNAITTYFTEYRKYPLETEMADLTTLTGEELMSVLMGSENEAALQRNPRKIAFFSDRPAKHVDGKYIKGVQMEKGERYFLLDTWGNQYLVRMDTNYDNRVSSPEDPTQLLPEAVIVWSAGPDGDFSTWDDNVKTW